ncbi:class I SAM-dependent methyltransferase [Ilumatobacter sp.]|uniref:class I SAM-dependent methyltransferase n=1 Tax=Ilumatobacter sp. TaxID=1967498 RepID=UPI003752134E
MPDLTKQKWRSKIEAKLLDSGAEDNHRMYGERKQEVIGAMSGTVVELGPGTGVNMRYYAPGVKVIAIEPNPVMHDPLRTKAAEHSVDLEIRTLRGESLDVDDGSVDGVVGTLLLCGVDDPAQVVREAHRVLKPAGTYFFIEHVESPAGHRNRTVQKVLLRPHRWMFNGCEITRDTAALLEAGPFESVEVTEVDRGRAALWVRHQIIGTAVKAAC